MTISLPCKRCEAVIAADNDNELVAKVQAHAHDQHDAHPSRKHILGHIRDQDPKEDTP